VAPTIYYKLLSIILENTFADELGAEDFQAIERVQIGTLKLIPQ
jgi:hypothetical protein